MRRFLSCLAIVAGLALVFVEVTAPPFRAVSWLDAAALLGGVVLILFGGQQWALDRAARLRRRTIPVADASSFYEGQQVRIGPEVYIVRPHVSRAGRKRLEELRIIGGLNGIGDAADAAWPEWSETEEWPETNDEPRWIRLDPSVYRGGGTMSRRPER